MSNQIAHKFVILEDCIKTPRDGTFLTEEYAQLSTILETLHAIDNEASPLNTLSLSKACKRVFPYLFVYRGGDHVSLHFKDEGDKVLGGRILIAVTEVPKHVTFFVTVGDAFNSRTYKIKVQSIYDNCKTLEENLQEAKLHACAIAFAQSHAEETHNITVDSFKQDHLINFDRVTKEDVEGLYSYADKEAGESVSVE